MWRMRDQDIAEVFDTDRMHLNAFGHQQIAFAVLDALGVEHAGAAPRPTPSAVLSRAEQLRENAAWTRDFLVPVGPPASDRTLLRRLGRGEAPGPGPDRARTEVG